MITYNYIDRNLKGTFSCLCFFDSGISVFGISSSAHMKDERNKKKHEKTKLDTEPEAKTDPVNAVEEKPQETKTLETELEPTKEMEK